jgi:hypothetical protein
LPSPTMVFSSTTTLLTFSIVGRSNMRSSSTCSRIERRPRAPVFRARAYLANRLKRLRPYFQVHAFHAK